jgi:hypothetical protein
MFSGRSSFKMKLGVILWQNDTEQDLYKTVSKFWILSQKEGILSVID